MKRIISKVTTEPENWQADSAFNALAVAFDKKGVTIKVRRVDLETALAAYNEKAHLPISYETVAVAPYRLRAHRQLCHREEIMTLVNGWRCLNTPDLIFHRKT